MGSGFEHFTLLKIIKPLNWVGVLWKEVDPVNSVRDVSNMAILEHLRLLVDLILALA